MVVTEVSGVPHETSAHRVLAARVRRLWRKIIEKHEERRTIARLSRLAPHLLSDMGLDPDRIYDAVANSWDEVQPGRFRRHD